ncbi:MAG TPA: serine/threonine-protein kinase [Longimicrobium sp.]|nr:serine/threonine-protein kinase [Longimicrobium sp.]
MTLRFSAPVGATARRTESSPTEDVPESLRSEFELSVLRRIGGRAHVVGLMGAESDGSPPFLEIVGGGSLAESRLFPASLQLARRILLQLLDAVEHCHAHGVIHRDLKPSNVLFTEEGELRLIDFDVAAYRGARSTIPGYEDVRIGTLPYSAPEQILDPATATYEAADIHALGVVLYEMLTGRIPWEMRDGEDEEAYRARIPFEDPVPPSAHRPDLPREIEAVILRALRRDPAARHSSVAELRAELEAAFRAAGAVLEDAGPVSSETQRAVPRRLPLLLLPLLPLLAWLVLSA